MDQQELSDAVWERMERHLRGGATDPGWTGRDNRLFVEAILWLARSGAHWRVLPKEFAAGTRCISASTAGVAVAFGKVFIKALNDGADFEYILVDSTIVRAHQHSAGAPKKAMIRRSV